MKQVEKFNYLEIMLADMISENKSWIQIMKTGSFTHPMYGSFKVTDTDLAKFERSFNEKVRGVDIAVDVEHEPEKGAVGWFKELQTRVLDDGKKALFALIDWTKEGADLVKSGKFKYISPDFTFKYKDEFGKMFDNVLNGCALTNRPFWKNMQPVVLSEAIILELKDGLLVEEHLTEAENLQARKNKAESKKIENKSKGVKKMSELSDKIKAIIETADVTDEALTAGVKEILGIKEAEVKADEATVAQLSELKSSNASMSKKVEALTLELNESKATKLVEEAITARKIAPAQKEWAKAYALSDPNGFKKFSETAVEIIDTKESGSGAGAGEEYKDKEIKLSESEIAMSKTLGVSEFDALNAKRARQGLAPIAKEKK